MIVCNECGHDLFDFYLRNKYPGNYLKLQMFCQIFFCLADNCLAGDFPVSRMISCRRQEIIRPGAVDDPATAGSSTATIIYSFDGYSPMINRDYY